MTTKTKHNNYLPKGLGWWNLYFIIKAFLYLRGTIDFHPIENFAFLALLLFPIRRHWLHSLRNFISIPLALWLLYYDSYLPPLSGLLNNLNQISQFDRYYLFTLFKRFISLNLLLSIFTLSVCYYLLKRTIKVTVLTILLLIFISTPLKNALLSNSSLLTQTNQNINITAPLEITLSPSSEKSFLTINDANLNEIEADFFTSQAKKVISLSNNKNIDAPFDLLFLSVCSLAWDDLKMAGLGSHPLLNSFDIIFDNFNSATSYSGPALIRLLRADCGQETHEQLFKNASSNECYLFENLKKIGFTENLLLNHNGIFDSFLNKLKVNGRIDSPPMEKTNLSPYLKSFDGSMIFRDRDVLDLWWSQRNTSPSKNIAALYNTISLHDGNRIISAPDDDDLSSYQLRLNNLLDDFYDFFKTITLSKRKVIVIFIPEHGVNLRGDKFQISGMREIPSPAIINIPVGLKIFGYQQQAKKAPIHVSSPSSYLAIAKLVSNLIENNLYQSQEIDINTLMKNLPETPIVAQNASTTVMEIQNNYYIALDDQTWTEYPSE
ncbi:cellulose biosynthesis protein BcsG [Shewanella surugensis]|uniref:Cellulose biosynthesis protein BcsG n=1 Tax=Shewanella surugensis TaxID=212020 RepID=A0ABT0L7K0_9GAMM|nr:cellulose biosynthesis protein BcsG [Shewanella surugensis]MCL1123635.1 cellulose biosynthesis protein BcsG [Shewanella surugensis]